MVPPQKKFLIDIFWEREEGRGVTKMRGRRGRGGGRGSHEKIRNSLEKQRLAPPCDHEPVRGLSVPSHCAWSCRADGHDATKKHLMFQQKMSTMASSVPSLFQ